LVKEVANQTENETSLLDRHNLIRLNEV